MIDETYILIFIMSIAFKLMQYIYIYFPFENNHFYLTRKEFTVVLSICFQRKIQENKLEVLNELEVNFLTLGKAEILRVAATCEQA